MKNWYFVFFVLILALLQLTFLDVFKFLGVKPDLIFISVLIASMVLERRWAIAIAILAGMLKDIFSVSTFGLNTILFPMWSVILAQVSRRIFIDNNLIDMGLVFIFAAVNNIIISLALSFAGEGFSFGIYMRIIFLESIYTALVFPSVLKLSSLFFVKETA